MTEAAHRPVLLEESLEALAIKPDGVYVDGTYGRGGHARALLSRLGPAGRLLALDRDAEASADGDGLARLDPRFAIEPVAFSRLTEVAGRYGLTGAVNGLLLDLGVSSPQLDVASRGFGFAADGPLDMRMDGRSGESAAHWLERASEEEIAQVLRQYGEERFSRRIARAIARARRQSAITTTRRLAEIVTATNPTREPGKHPATRTFQAIRIHVNNELDELRTCLSGVCDLLALGGRLVVISFHSLEDRIVKRFIRDQSRGQRLPRGLPVPGGDGPGRLRAVGKLVRPSAAEVASNPRARSARMRVAERLA